MLSRTAKTVKTTKTVMKATPPLNPAGWPGFGSVRLRFGDGTVRAVPAFGSGGSSKQGVLVFFQYSFLVFFQYSFTERTVPVPVSVPAVPAVPVRRSVPAKTRGPENGAFGKPCFCPARKRGFLTKMAKMTNLHSKL